jgi:hypothetical protein
MKKTLLFLVAMVGFLCQAQETQYYNALPNNGSTSGNSRAPQGLQRYSRTVYIITAAEMAASGLSNGDVINSIGFNYSSAQDVPTTGSFIVYMENSTDATNTKSTTWSTAITGMTTVSNSSITIPAQAGQVNFPFSGGSTFTYTGGGVYVAFEYQNPTSAVATTPNVALCSTTLTGGLKSGQSTTLLPTTIAASNWRPETFLGKDVVCASPTGIAVSSITENSASVSWTESGSNFSIQYGVDGFTLGSGTIVNSISSPYNFSSLNSGTDYSFYIKKYCTSPNESVWAGPYSFTTIFSAVTPPYNYGFETNDDWSILNAGTGNNWGIYTQAAPIPLAAEGTTFAGYVYNATNAANAWLFSRRLNLTAGTNYSIKFKYKIADGTVYQENFKVTMGTDKTVAAQTNILQTYTDVNLQVWTQADLNFTPTTSEVYYLAFNCTSPADRNILAIDDIQITSVLSSDSFESNEFTIYPNPATTILNISNTNNVEIKNISVTDINGRVVKNQSDSLSQINVSDLNAGVYFVTIEAAEGKTTKKFIKQ